MIRKIAAVTLGFALAALFTWLLVRALDWRLVWANLAAARKGWLLLALGALVTGYGARMARWRMLLKFTGTRASLRAVAPSFLAGFALNNVLPLRAGDVMRTLMIRNAIGVPLADGVGTLLVERFWDLAILGIFFAVGLQAADRHSSSAFVPGATAVVSLGVMGLLTIGLAGSRITRLAEAIARKVSFAPRLFRFTVSFCRSLESVSRPKKAGKLAMYSFAAWICEAAVLYWCARAIGLDLSVSAVCFIISAANFSGLIPGTPGNVGTFEFFAVLAAGAFAIDPNYAAAFAILFHAVVWLPITIVGAALLIAESRSLRRIAFSPRIKNTG